MDRGELAKSYFMKGYNCSQSVFTAFAYRFGIDEDTAKKISAIVVGAGNLWRGAGAASEMNRVDADKMGMLATAMNALMLKNVFNALGENGLLCPQSREVQQLLR